MKIGLRTFEHWSEFLFRQMHCGDRTEDTSYYNFNNVQIIIIRFSVLRKTIRCLIVFVAEKKKVAKQHLECNHKLALELIEIIIRMFTEFRKH